ncbi:MAG: hypothetical protein ACREBC_02190 [Pyrinomonadaceae bacterium]
MKYSRFLYTAVLIAALLPGAGCLRKRKLYFVPLGDFSTAMVDDLASYYRNKYGLLVETLPSVPLIAKAINPERQQLIAEAAVEIMREANPQLRNDPQAILIGLTTHDMYIAKYDWRFSFSWREQGKYAVVSSGRMNLPIGGRSVSADEIRTRLRKMVTKNIGVLYYHLAQSDNPRSVLYRNVGGIQELDYMGEEF